MLGESMVDNPKMLALRTLRHDQLQPGMIIREITELSFEYATLDADTVRFLKANFKGASAVVLGDAGVHTGSIAELKEFDQLQSITHIPEELRIAKVVRGLRESLFKRGFLEFKVSVPASVEVAASTTETEAPAVQVGSAEAHEAYQEKVIQVTTFLETVNPALDSREKGATVIEEMMDHGRTGRFSDKGVEAAVAEIMEQNLGPAMQAIAGLKGSDQTYAHCVDMSVILQGCYSEILEKSGKKVNEAINRLILMSGFMHDIGKSKLPKEIIESTEYFAPESDERIIIRNHPAYGAKILEDMGAHRASIDMAHFHHVRKDKNLLTSYPDVPFESVPPIVRFAAIVDVYQALIGKRSYKRNWVPGKAIEYILNRKNSEFDSVMVNLFVETMGTYPVISLVRLNTGDLAFVLIIAPKDHPDRPVVTIVENAKGERITHHEVLDLMTDPDVWVDDVVDHFEHYNETVDQTFRIFQSITVA